MAAYKKVLAARNVNNDPKGSGVGTNPIAEYDPDQAHAQSGEAQSGLPLAPGENVANTMWEPVWPMTGPSEVPSDRAPIVQENKDNKPGFNASKTATPKPDGTPGVDPWFQEQNGDATGGFGPVPVQGYQETDHGQMWPWDINGDPKGAADVAGTPTPGAQNGYPQPSAQTRAFRERVQANLNSNNEGR